MGKQKVSSKSWLIGLIVGIGTILIGAIVTVLVLTLGGVTKTDYKDAAKATSSIVDYINDSKEDFSSLAMENISEKHDIEMVKSKIIKFKNELSSAVRVLGDKKAVQKDKEATRKYNELKVAYDKYKDYLDLSIQLHDSIMPIFTDIKSFVSEHSSVDSSTPIAEVAETIVDIHNFSYRLHAGTKNKVINQSIREISDAFYAMATELEKWRIDGSISESEYRENIEQIVSSMNESMEKFQKEVASLDDIAKDFTDKVNELNKYLSEKSGK
ncbi:hypothetical protein FWF74_01835 [Candidatus Saccharibacteria bacterium]|nr:hypothetical protein [Candidatus Saccharibacteria bacterium]MCL1963077.1 hypothetical protein [Candidatus Saccharibacteria bacterium]